MFSVELDVTDSCIVFSLRLIVLEDLYLLVVLTILSLR